MKMPEKKPAEEIFKQFCERYQHRDLQGLLALFTQNTNMWGSGLDEYRCGIREVEEQLKRDWMQAEQGEIEVVAFVPSPQDALWAAAVCNVRLTIQAEEHFFEHFRGTIVIENENGSWKIAHMHASFPDYRNAENGSFPVNN